MSLEMNFHLSVCANFPSFAASKPSLEAQSASSAFFPPFLQSFSLIALGLLTQLSLSGNQMLLVWSRCLWMPHPSCSQGQIAAWGCCLGQGLGRCFRTFANFYLQVLTAPCKRCLTSSYISISISNGGNKYKRKGLDSIENVL